MDYLTDPVGRFCNLNCISAYGSCSLVESKEEDLSERLSAELRTNLRFDKGFYS